MKPFQLPTWRKRQINAKYARKARVIVAAVRAMELTMRTAVDQIMDHAISTGQYREPTLNSMYAVSEHFYRSVVEQAFYSCKDEKKEQAGRRKLARGKGPQGIPRTMRDLHAVFSGGKEWPKIMKRSKKLTDRLRKAYLGKLKKKFEQVMPKITSGEWTPAEAKEHLMSAWKSSESRVETIFRTETTNYFGAVQVAFFDGDPEIIGFMFDSVRDSSRTNICRSRHGLIYKPGSQELRENTPGLHWNCRSHLIALANTPHNRKLLEDPDRDPSKNSVAPLPNGWRK